MGSTRMEWAAILLLADYARDEPVYQFDDSLLQRLQSRRIGATTIDNGLVVVHLDQ